jgi:hypothetical protein
MQNISSFLNANPWLNLIFLILAIVSIIVSVTLYFRSRKEKILVYMTKSFNLIHNSVVRIPGLSVKYEDNNIDNLTLTKIAFWNKGKGTINNVDIAPTDKLSIFPAEDVKILSATITYKSRDSNNYYLDKVENKIIVNFDYIDFHQGVIVNIYHTGKDNNSIIIKGTVIGGRDIQIGNISEDYLLQRLIDHILKKFPKPHNMLFKLLWYIIFIGTCIIPTMIIMPIDKFYRMMNKLPAEFDLSSKKME